MTLVRLMAAENVRDRHAGAEHPRRIDGDVELRLLPALDEHAGDAAQTIQPRLDLVGRQLPELGCGTVSDVRL